MEKTGVAREEIGGIRFDLDAFDASSDGELSWQTNAC